MSDTEYAVEVLNEDGTWMWCWAGEAAQMRTIPGALAALDHARSMFPAETYRLGVRVIPGFVPADEDALRRAAGPVEATSGGPEGDR